MARKRFLDADLSAEERGLGHGDGSGNAGWMDHNFASEEHHARGPWRRSAGCLVPLVLLGAVAYGGYAAYQHLDTFFGAQTCRMTVDGHEEKWRPEQAANASTIATVGVLRDGLPIKAAHIAVTTAIQESKLKNLTYGDRDSLGLFQQRPSQGWGTAAQIGDPVYASNAFYQRLVKLSGWQTRPLTEVAQEVQHSGHPDAYAAHEQQGAVIASVLGGQTHAAVGCRLDPAGSSTQPATLVTKLRHQTGLNATVSGAQLSVTPRTTQQAWAVAGWAVTHAESDGINRVTVGDQQWQRQRGRAGWSWAPAARPTSGSTTVRIELA